MHFITDEQVREAISFDDALVAIKGAFMALGRSKAANLDRGRASIEGQTISAMGAVIPDLGVMGVKVYPTLKGKFNFSISLFSIDDGRLLAVIDANALTELRTAATTLLAAQMLANPVAKKLAIFGSGIQAKAHAKAFLSHYPLASVRVVDPHGKPQELCDWISCTFDVEATVEQDPAGAASEADLIVLATRSKTALFPGTAPKKGAFVAAIGSSKPDTREIDDALLLRSSCIAVESWDQALQETGDFVLASRLPVERIVELGLLVAGRATVDRTKGDLALYKSVGIGLEDVALASAVLSRLTGPRLPPER